jgi:predicted  nucleic acid-binding Zn-ribbon protein
MLVLSFALSAPPGVARAQNQRPPEDQELIKALLVEVRLLRQAFERLNLNGYRSQILVERIRAQNDKVARLSRSVDDARDEVSDTLTAVNQINERMKSTDAMVQQETDEKRRAPMEQELKELKLVADVQKQREQRVREREHRLTEQLRLEQAKLDDFEGRLDALEREILNEIERQDSKTKSTESKKPE